MSETISPNKLNISGHGNTAKNVLCEADFKKINNASVNSGFVKIVKRNEYLVAVV